MDAIRNDLLAQVVQRDGRVIMLFSRRHEASGDLVSEKTDHYMVDPAGALMMAECLSTMAFEADSGLKPVGETLKASLVKQHREKLEPRLTIMLNSQRENRTLGNKALARQVMDVIFSEIFS